MARLLWGVADSNLMELNTSMWRVKFPADALEAAGHHCTIRHIGALFSPQVDDETKRAIGDSEIIILERLLIEPFHKQIVKWRESGKKVWATFDDNYALMPKSAGSTHAWHGGERLKTAADELVEKYGVQQPGELNKIINEFRQGLRLVDGAIVPSRVLSDDYRPFCGNIQYIPNFPSEELWRDVRKRPPDGNIIIGWGGSSAHDISWQESGLSAALGNICRKYPRVHIRIFGLSLYIKRMLDTSNVRYSGGTWMPFTEWPKEVGGWDIGLAPLGGEYDRRRSAIKVMECGMAEMPSVVTNDAPYEDAMGCIRVKNRTPFWEKALVSLVEDEHLRRNLATQANLWVHKIMADGPKMYEEVLGITSPKLESDNGEA